MSEEEKSPLLGVISRAQAAVGLLLAVIALLAAVLGGASWAVAYQADAQIDKRIDSEKLVRTRDLENVRQLLDLRLGAIERRQAEGNDRLEYLYRRELERSGRRTSGDRGGG